MLFFFIKEKLYFAIQKVWVKS